MFRTLVKKRDFYAGGLMTLIGAAVTFNSWHFYSLGTLTHMGPGMFPLMLGITLTFVGVLILGAAVATPLSDDEAHPAGEAGMVRLGLYLGRAGRVHHPRRIFRPGAGDLRLRASSPRSAIAPRR